MGNTIEMKSYDEELRELHHRRVYHIILTCGFLMALFGILDYIIVPAYFSEFAGYRIVVVLCSLALLLVNYLDKRKKYTVLIGLQEYVLVTFVLLLMIYQMGGLTSPYFVGLLVIIALYATLAPLTAIQTLVSGFFVVCSYGILIQLHPSSQSPQALDLFNNLFFMSCFILIIATQSWTDTAARRKEYKLRRQEHEANEELTHHSELLEQEVEKRTLEQEATEKRYRLLFNEITDDVVFLNPEGEILQTNESFKKNYGSSRSNQVRSLYELVESSDRRLLRNLLNNVITYGKPIETAKFSLKKNTGTSCKVEANLSLITRNYHHCGILLVMRDLSMRQQLEDRLITSLKLKKKTESAAIIALAKLSEYREYTPQNHLERIREYCQILASQLSGQKEFEKEIKENFIHDIYHASILHDIGKVAIPDAILTKKNQLTEHEKEIIRQHTILGGDVINEMEKESQNNSFLPMAKDIAYFHHERWDGTGFPKGLKHNEIPLAARIMALVDLYEELTAIANINAVLDHKEAVEVIVQNSNFRLDPKIVESFFLCQEEFIRIKTKYSTPQSD